MFSLKSECFRKSRLVLGRSGCFFEKSGSFHQGLESLRVFIRIWVFSQESMCFLESLDVFEKSTCFCTVWVFFIKSNVFYKRLGAFIKVCVFPSNVDVFS